MITEHIHGGKIIRTLRRRANLTQGEVSVRLGKPRHYVASLERNQLSIDQTDFKKLIRAIGCTMEDYESLKATDLLLESLSIHPTHEAVGAERAVGTHLHTKEEIATILKEYFKDSKVDRAFLFGSYSRGTQSTVSDIDILISFDEAAKATIFDLVGIKLDLEDIFQRPVDLVQKGTEYDHVKESMEADKVLVYG